MNYLKQEELSGVLVKKQTLETNSELSEAVCKGVWVQDFDI